MNRLTKKVENEERYIANNFKREKGERLFTTIDNYNAKVYNKLGQLEDLQEEIGCPLEVICWLLQGKPILVLNPIDKSLQEIENPLNFYDSTRQAFDIKNNLFKTTHEKRIWNTGGVIVYLKDHKKTWWLKANRSE